MGQESAPARPGAVRRIWSYRHHSDGQCQRLFPYAVQRIVLRVASAAVGGRGVLDPL